MEYAVDMSFNLTTGGNSAQCGIYLDIGVEYVIDLFRNEFLDRLQAQGLCGLVRPWSSVTAQEEEFLRESCESYDPCEGTCGDFQVSMFLHMALWCTILEKEVVPRASLKYGLRRGVAGKRVLREK